MSSLFITVAVFVCVSAVVGAVTLMFRDGGAAGKLDDRLSSFTGTGASAREQRVKESLLLQPAGSGSGIFEKIVKRFARLSLLFEQANTTLTASKFFALSGLIGAGCAFMTLALRGPLALAPVMGALGSGLPLMWLVMRRRSRLKRFQVQLPDALELIGRALRAGHSLQAGFNLVHEEMTDPIRSEFGRVHEESNLGITIEDALMSMTDRVPNLDLKFFATSVILQRQTGGDLAEILDKISNLIRERFRIWGQVQALTGEGRLSGIVLLALPPALFMAVYSLNQEYIMSLFQDPMGTKMLAGAIVMQILGALVIKKIVNIKV